MNLLSSRCLYTSLSQSLAPTILFLAFVTPITSMYEKYARSFTDWENHKHRSTHEASLTIKSFAVSALVAYLNMALSAFLYVPFGAGIMTRLQSLFHGRDQNLFSVDAVAAKGKLNAGRLQDQMYAYGVTNSGVNAFMELGLPFIMRYVDSIRNGHRKVSGGRKKRVGFEDYNSDEGSTASTPTSPTPGTLSRTPSIAAAQASKEEREFLERVRGEVMLTEYELFADYSEMVTQFGYIVLWSAIWPIASGQLASFSSTIIANALLSPSILQQLV
jgi:anoctamin-10